MATSLGWGLELTADGTGTPGMHEGSCAEKSSPRPSHAGHTSWVQMGQRDPLRMASSQDKKATIPFPAFTDTPTASQQVP